MDYVSIANQYIEDVLNKEISACVHVVNACKRQFDDLAKKDFAYEFDEESANRICRFAELMPHIKGQLAGQSLKLEPFQCFILTTVFGWLNKETGFRRFRTAYVEVPRKNGKSFFSSGIGLYMGFADGEEGAEVYSAATTRDQAKIVFGDAWHIARRTKPFLDKFKVQVGGTTSPRSLFCLDTNSKFEPLSAEGNSLDGLNVHCGIIDELHAHRTRSVFDVIETATGARTQSLLWLITTAGSNRAGVCYEQRAYVLKILEGRQEDDSYFGIIYTIDEGDDWTTEEAWIKANPNYGVSVMPDDIERLARKAQSMTSAQNNFLTKRLNVWVNAETAWMDMKSWENCGDQNLSIEDFIGDRCWIGIDLASKIDIAAMLMVFYRGGKYYAFGKYYLPSQTVENNANSQYEGWAKDKMLTVTHGYSIDFARIEKDLIEASELYQVVACAYDPHQATQMSQRMVEKGIEMVEIRPTVMNFSEPMKELESLVLNQKFVHDGCPVLEWMISNVVCHVDAKDNIYPRKERPENKIDGVVALIMALGRALFNEEEEIIESIYERVAFDENNDWDDF